MIIDLRTYTYLPSKYRTFLKGYEEIGFGLTSKHLGTTLGVFRPESGVQNRTFQFFMYRDSPHRDFCRQGMLADPAWADFVKIDSDALLQQMNTLLVPTDFSPLRGIEDASPPSSEAPSRLFELRTWTLQPSRSDDALTLSREEVAPAMAVHEVGVVGWFTADTGEDHRLMRLTAYADASARDAARANLRADSDASTALSSLRALATAEEAQLLLPLPYSPLR